MDEYFNLKLEFDQKKVDKIIALTINTGQKGYVCSVEGNIFSLANRDDNIKKIVNSALVNICDGKSIAFLASIIYKKRLRTYIGADLFIDYIRTKDYRYLFLGNTKEVLNGLRSELTRINPKINNMNFIELPFNKVHEFDYKVIAEEVNSLNPDIIWVSLGAPKQEEFMCNLLPFIKRGVMFGFGAIFNFYSGIASFKRAPKLFRIVNAEWIYRIYQEPQKQLKRVKLIIKIMPKVVYHEFRKSLISKKKN